MSTLLAGDTAWWDDELIVEAFGLQEGVTVLGQGERPRFSKARAIDAEDEDSAAKVLQLGYEQIVFFSSELSGEGASRGEFKALPSLLENLMRESRDARILYVATDDVDFERESGDTVRQRALEELCVWYRGQGLDLTVLRVPHPSAADCEKDYWRRVCGELAAGRSWSFDVSAEQPCDFVDMRDLARLIGTVFDDWQQAEVLRLHASGDHSCGEAAEKLRGLFPQAELEFSETPANVHLDKAGEMPVEELYGFSCEHDVVGELGEREIQVDAAGDVEEKGAGKSFLERIRDASPLATGIELAVGYALVELLDALLGTVIGYQLIDLRLVYVVLFAATYGVRVGVASSLIMAFSAALAALRQGWDFPALFSDPNYWLALVLYLVVGSSLGYLRQKGDEDRAFAEKRTEHLENQARFMKDLYDEACESRNTYRHNLIESRDGFGRIFDVVKRLSLEEPSRIFSASIGVLEDVLDTEKAAIYVINDQRESFARLVVSSEALNGKLKKSILLQDFSTALKTLDSGDVWFNSKLTPGLPSYIAGVKSQGEVRVLIMIYDVPFDQASAFYMNLVRILSGLMENFLIHAWNDEKARDAVRHVPGTGLLTREELVKELETLRETRKHHVGDYRILRIGTQGRELGEVYRELARQVRSTDIMGVGRDGNVYVLLQQVDDTTLPIVEDRYKRAGIQVEQCEDEGAL